MQSYVFICTAVCSLLIIVCSSLATDCSGRGCEAPSWVESRKQVTSGESRSYVELHVSQGAPVTLRCRAHGNPRPQLRWYRNNIPLTANTLPKVLFHRWSIKFPRLRVADSGNFSCVASNQYGSLIKHFSLSVYGPATKEKLVLVAGYPSNVTTFTGRSAILTCRVMTNVPFTARWLRYLDDIATLVEITANVGQIRDSVEDHSDMASDSSPETEDEDIVLPSRNSTVPVDDSAEVIQETLWRRRYDLSMELDVSSSSSSQEDESDVKLIIQKAMPSDSGRYACLIMSEHARIERSAWLKVHAADEIEQAYAERRERWQKRWGSEQGPEEYLRGIVIAVSVSFVVIVISIVVLFVMAILKAYRRQDVVLHIYDLRGHEDY